MNPEIIKSVQMFNTPQSYLADKRLSTIYHTDFKFQLKKYERLNEWEIRRPELIEQILVSSGLWPLPKKCELEARIFGRQEFNDFSVENFIFQSYPGFYVTGNLFKPLNKKGPFPAILNPHGHWDNGRLENSDLCRIPTRCANFAKMGFVAISYDMVGYLDSKQLRHDYGGFAHEMWSVGLFGLQLWNSIRCVDFLQTLEEADKELIGCTGASGGATQTFFLAAVDNRIKVTMPVNMISAHFQGGCSCENSPLLRINTNNVELAALTAPRPMLMTGCTGDWSKNIPDVEYPYIHSFYELYNASDRVEYFYDNAEHNYNKNTRETAYKWFGKWFSGVEKDWKEQEVDFGDLNNLRIYSDLDMPDGIKSEADLFYIQKKFLETNLYNLLTSCTAENKGTLNTGMRHVFGISSTPTACLLNKTSEIHNTGLSIKNMLIGEDEGIDQTPVTVIKNTRYDRHDKMCLIIHPEGKAKLYEDTQWNGLACKLIDNGWSIASTDVFLTGEYDRPYSKAGRDYTQNNYFTTFNYTDDALRVKDIIKVYKYLFNTGDYKNIDIIGLGAAGLWCLAALGFLEGTRKAIVDMNGFDINDDDAYIKKFFVPGFLAAGGFKTSVQLGDPETLVLFNTEEKASNELLISTYNKRSSILTYKDIPDLYDLLCNK